MSGFLGGLLGAQEAVCRRSEGEQDLDQLGNVECAGVRYIRGDAAIIDADYPGRGGITPSGGTTDCANGNPRQASPNVTTSQHFTYSREQSNHATSHDLSQPHPNPNASHATHFGHGVRFDMAE